MCSYSLNEKWKPDVASEGTGEQAACTFYRDGTQLLAMTRSCTGQPWEPGCGLRRS